MFDQIKLPLQGLANLFCRGLTIFCRGLTICFCRGLTMEEARNLLRSCQGEVSWSSLILFLERFNINIYLLQEVPECHDVQFIFDRNAVSVFVVILIEFDKYCQKHIKIPTTGEKSRLVWFICSYFKWDSQVVIIIITSGGHYHRARPRKRASSPSCTGDYPLDISFVCWNHFVRKGWEEETEEAAHDRATTFRPHIRWWAPPYIVAHCISFLICINFFLMGCVLFSPCVYQNTWTCVLILSDSKSSSNETSASCPLHLRCVCVVVSS